MIRLTVLITAVLAVAAAASLLEHSGPAGHSSKQQKKAAEGAEVLVKKQLTATSAAGKQEEVGLQQLTKRWGSRFSKARARSHGERSATVNERVARDYLNDDDEDFGYDDANEGIDYRQKRDYLDLLGFPSLNKVQQQQHKLASRGILASRSEEANKKRSNLGEARTKRLLEGELVNILSGKQVAEMKRKIRNEKVENNKLVEKDYVGMIDDEDDKVKKVEKKETQWGRVSRNYLDATFGEGDQETEERVSRDYLEGILGKEEEQKRVSRDYIDTILGEDRERVSRDYLDTIFGGGGLGERQSRDYLAGILGKEEEQKRVSRDYIDTILGDGEDRERVSRDYLGTIFGGGGLGERQSRDYMEGILGEDDQKTLRVSRDYLDVILGSGYGSSHNSDPYGSSHSSYPYGIE